MNATTANRINARPARRRTAAKTTTATPPKIAPLPATEARKPFTMRDLDGLTRDRIIGLIDAIHEGLINGRTSFGVLAGFAECIDRIAGVPNDDHKPDADAAALLALWSVADVLKHEARDDDFCVGDTVSTAQRFAVLAMMLHGE